MKGETIGTREGEVISTSSLCLSGGSSHIELVGINAFDWEEENCFSPPTSSFFLIFFFLVEMIRQSSASSANRLQKIWEAETQEGWGWGRNRQEGDASRVQVSSLLIFFQILQSPVLQASWLIAPAPGNTNMICVFQNIMKHSLENVCFAGLARHFSDGNISKATRARGDETVGSLRKFQSHPRSWPNINTID